MAQSKRSTPAGNLRDSALRFRNLTRVHRQIPARSRGSDRAYTVNSEEPDYGYSRRLPRGRLAIMIAGIAVWIVMPPMSIGQPGVAWPFVK